MRKGIDYNDRQWEERILSGKMIDISSQRFGNLVALFPVVSNGQNQWLCKCDCGNEIVVPYGRLQSKNTKSCGCLQRNAAKERWIKYREENNIIGQKFGRLTAIEFLRIESQEAIYLFRCDCGSLVELSMHSVKQGNTSSCGCLRQEISDTYKTDIVGKKFGKLLVLSCIGLTKHGAHKYKCLCDCGGYITVERQSLIGGDTQSCGCIRSIGENNIKQILTDSNLCYKMQYSFPDLLSDNNVPMPYDFALLDDDMKVYRLIEFDGSQHVKPYDYFGGIEKFMKVKRNDNIKNQYASSHNIPLVRIPYTKRDSMSITDILGEKYLIN